MKIFFKHALQDFPIQLTDVRGRLNSSVLIGKTILFVLFFLQSFLLSAQWISHIDCECDMDPFVTFSEDSGLAPNDGIICSGETLTISAFGGFSYKWSTGDTTNTITVNGSGGYGVTISDASGCIAVENVLITEHSKPFLLYDESFCEGTTTSIRVNGRGVSYLWSTGATTNFLPVTEGGTYSVTITDAFGCVHIDSATIQEIPTLEVAIQVTEQSGNSNDGIVCRGDQAVLNATPGYVSYQWSPSTGLNNTTIANPTASPMTTTTYTVLVTDENGCRGTETVTITVSNITTGVGPTQRICFGNSTTLQATGGASYRWSPATGLNNVTSARPTARPSATTTYTVLITDTNGCTSQHTQTVEVVTVSVDIQGDALLCRNESTTLTAVPSSNFSGSTYTYLWSNNSTNNTISVAPATTTTYFVTITDNNNCTAVDSVVVSVIDLQVGLGLGDTICLGDSLEVSSLVSVNGVFQPDSNFTFDWQPATVPLDSTTGRFVLKPTISTTYTVTATDVNGCTAVDSILVAVNDYEIEAGADQLICLGDSTLLNPTLRLNGVITTGTGASILYRWRPSQGLRDTTIATPIASPTTSTIYRVLITDGNGCTATDSISITVNDLQVDAGENQAICPGDSISLSPTLTLNGNVISDSSATVIWSPSRGINDTTAFEPRVSPDTTITYFLTVIDSNGCRAEDSISIEVYPRIEPRLGTLPTNINYLESTQFLYLQSSPVPIVQFSWSPTDFLACEGDTTLNCSEPVFTDVLAIDSIYTYTLTVVDTNGCSEREVINVNVNINNSPPPAEMATVSGTVYTETGDKIEGGTIHLLGDKPTSCLTNQLGDFRFEEIPMYEHYTLQPEDNTNPLNGVSTADLVRMHKHILGIEILDSPYKMIAADVNKSKHISIADIVELRKMILNIIPSFSNNSSWRFIDASYQFKEPTQPLEEEVPEVYTIAQLEENMEELNFVAVKIGDVNNSVTTHPLSAAESRAFQGTLEWTIQTTFDEEEATVTYHFYPKDFEQIEGYQFSIDFDKDGLQFERLLPSAQVQEGHFGWNGVERGIITTSWNRTSDLAWEEETALFSLVFSRKDKQKHIPIIGLSSSSIPSEAYSKTGDLLSVKSLSNPGSNLSTRKPISLYQNEPNPFTGQTVIGFYLPKVTNATISIFNEVGQELKVYEGFYEQGYNRILLESNELPAHGAFYYQLATAEKLITKKMIYIQ